MKPAPSDEHFHPCDNCRAKVACEDDCDDEQQTIVLCGICAEIAEAGERWARR